VLSALEDLGLQATFYESKGMGKGEKYTVSSGKGSGTQKMAYSTRSIVVSIVDFCFPYHLMLVMNTF
jgi:hypothetical protein